jgi:hypothetical protein
MRFASSDRTRMTAKLQATLMVLNSRLLRNNTASDYVEYSSVSAPMNAVMKQSFSGEIDRFEAVSNMAIPSYLRGRRATSIETGFRLRSLRQIKSTPVRSPFYTRHSFIMLRAAEFRTSCDSFLAKKSSLRIDVRQSYFRWPRLCFARTIGELQ